MLVLGYCILTFPWLVPPDTNHSFIKTSNQLNKNRICQKKLYNLYTSVTSKNLKTYDVLGKRHINQQKKNQLKSSFRIKMKNHLVSEKFLSFSSRIKQPLPRLVIKVLLGSNTKETQKAQSQKNYDGVDVTKQKEKR